MLLKSDGEPVWERGEGRGGGGSKRGAELVGMRRFFEERDCSGERKEEGEVH